MTAGALTEVTGGVWRWTAPRSGASRLGRQVASYVLAAPDAVLLVDPLLPEPDPDEVADAVELLAAGREVHVLITIGYHARSADALADRFDALIWGPPTVDGGLRDPNRLTVLEPGKPGPAGAVAHRSASRYAANARSGCPPTPRSRSATPSSPPRTVSCAFGPRNRSTRRASASTASGSPRRSRRYSTIPSSTC